MSWRLRHGDNERFLRRLAELRARKGQSPPKALTNKPSIPEHLIPLWHAWHALALTRPLGMGAASSIPWSEWSRYCDDHMVRGETKLRWCRMLMVLDAFYVSRANSRSKDADSRAER